MNATNTLTQRKERCALEMENQILGEELLNVRTEYWRMRHLASILGAAVLFLGTTHPVQWVLWVVGVFFILVAALTLIGGVCWAAKRGDEAMGIGDTQGR